DRLVDTGVVAGSEHRRNLLRHLGARRSLWEPAVALPPRPALRGRRRATDPDGWPGPLDRARPDAEALEVPALPVVDGELVGERGLERVDALVEHAAPVLELSCEHAELVLDVTRADTDDEPAVGETVERRERFRRLQWVPVAHHPDMRHQSHVVGDGGEESESGDGVVPRGAHRGREPFGDGDVVAHGD